MRQSFPVLKAPARLAWSPPPLLGPPLPSQCVFTISSRAWSGHFGGGMRAASHTRERTSPFPHPLHSVA